MNRRLITGCVRNIRARNYRNLILGFQVTVKMSAMFFETQCSALSTNSWTDSALQCHKHVNTNR